MTVPVEIQQIFAFLQQHTPFAELPQKLLLLTAQHVEISYHPKGTDLRTSSAKQTDLNCVRSGAVMLLDEQGELLDKLSAGGCFWINSQEVESITVEDCLLYSLSDELFSIISEQDQQFSRFFHQRHEQRLNAALQKKQQDSAYTQTVRQLMNCHLIHVSPQTTILETARLMNNRSISSVTVLDGEGGLAGILTDQDLRKRVVARELDIHTSIEKVMTPEPITIDCDSFIDQAIIKMVQSNIHHLPVMEGSAAVGMLTVTDLIRQQKSEPVLLISAIHKAESVHDLVAVSHDIPALLQSLIAADVKADVLARLLTMVTDTLTQQLIRLGQEQLGPEPLPFIWLAFGSQARQDQSAKSDQDNGLLLHNDRNDEHEQYFKQLADFVCGGLNACGYVYCPGAVMASNGQWRKTLNQWQDVFSHWINLPEPAALINCSIFFDLRPIYTSKGASGLFTALQNSILEQAQQSIFLAVLASNALLLRPPLGFFRQLVLERSGEHKNTLDIKLHGLLPITDIARIHALANGINTVSTIERLQQLGKAKVMTQQDVSNLLDAQEFIAHTRLLHQGEQLAVGAKADNYLDPEKLSDLVKHQLKDAFQIVGDAQRVLRVNYLREIS